MTDEKFKDGELNKEAVSAEDEAKGRANDETLKAGAAQQGTQGANKAAIGEKEKEFLNTAPTPGMASAMIVNDILYTKVHLSDQFVAFGFVERGIKKALEAYYMKREMAEMQNKKIITPGKANGNIFQQNLQQLRSFLSKERR